LYATRTLGLERSQTHQKLRRLALSFVEKLKMKSVFSARRENLDTQTLIEDVMCVILVHANNWALFDVHHISIPPGFSPLLYSLHSLFAQYEF
jgi:hypothetical protein